MYDKVTGIRNCGNDNPKRETKERHQRTRKERHDPYRRKRERKDTNRITRRKNQNIKKDKEKPKIQKLKTRVEPKIQEEKQKTKTKTKTPVEPPNVKQSTKTSRTPRQPSTKHRKSSKKKKKLKFRLNPISSQTRKNNKGILKPFFVKDDKLKDNLKKQAQAAFEQTNQEGFRHHDVQLTKALSEILMLSQNHAYALTDACNTYMNDFLDLFKDPSKPTPKPKKQTKTKTKTKTQTPTQKGGDLATDCYASLVKYLKYELPDTQHDFGKGRNGVFPRNFNSEMFLKEAMQYLDTDGDKLKPYYTGEKPGTTPGKFEDIVKNDFLLGNLCQDVEYISYFFNGEIPKKNPASEIFNRYVPSTVPELFKTLEDYKYKYCIFDACMSVQKEKEFSNKITTLKSMCNLWDPAGKATYDDITECTDFDTSGDLGLIKETNVVTASDNKQYTLYDCKYQKFGSPVLYSLYDEAYDNILNENCLDGQGIKFKLRLGSQMNNNSLMIVLGIFTDGTPTWFPIRTGGFSVKTLSYGLLYAINNENRGGNGEDFTILKGIIDHVRIKLKGKLVIDAEIKKLLFRMLTRFKSSGDHGSAQTSYLLNKHCGSTLYLSGDQLCYLYSIMIGAPTVFRYFAGSGDSGEDDDNICEPNPNRTHFIGTYLPPPDEKAIFDRQLERQREFLKKHFKKTNSPSIASPQYQSPNFQVELNNNIKFMDSIRESVITTPDQTNTIITQNKQTLKTIKKNIRNFFDKMNRIKIKEQIDENVKKSMNTAEKLLHNLYFMENAEEIRKLYEDTFKSQQEFMEQNVYRIGSSRRSSFSWSTSNTIQLLKNSFKNFRSGQRNVGAGDFINKLRQDSDKDSIYNNIIRLKKKFKEAVTNTSSEVKTKYGPSAIFLEEQGRKMLDAKYATIQAQLASGNDGMGEVIAELFDIAKVAPVVAEPVSEAGPGPGQSSETSKTTDGKNQKTFGNKTRKRSVPASSKNRPPKQQRVTTPSRGSPTSVTMEEE